jgi:hypothetical protein
MFSVKASGIAAFAAFIASVIIGIINKSGVFVIILRGLLCGLLFFALVAAGHIFIARYLPELLKLGKDEEESDEPGSRVDISVEDEDESSNEDTENEKTENPDDKDQAFKEAVANAMNPQDGETDQTGEAQESMDQNGEKEYTEENGEDNIFEAKEKKEGNEEDHSAEKPPAEIGRKAVPPGEKEASGSSSREGEESEPSYSLPQKAQSGNNSGTSQTPKKKADIDPSKLDPKQMASTIQTMLRQEE